MFYKKEKYVKDGHMLARCVKIISKLLILDNVSFGSAWSWEKGKPRRENGKLESWGGSLHFYISLLSVNMALIHEFLVLTNRMFHFGGCQMEMQHHQQIMLGMWKRQTDMMNKGRLQSMMIILHQLGRAISPAMGKIWSPEDGLQISSQEFNE